MTMPQNNRMYDVDCIHVRNGELKAIEELTFATLPGAVDDDFRYGKGPDRMRICAYCAGMLWSTLTDYPFAKKKPASIRAQQTAEELYPVGVGLMRMVQRHADQLDAERAERKKKP